MEGKIIEPPHKSSIGNLDANVMALLSYIISSVLGFIPVISYIAWAVPLVIFFVEKQSKFVKFHALQSFFLNLVGFVLGLIVSLIVSLTVAASVITDPYAAMGSIAATSVITLIISIVILVFAIIALIKAYKYEVYKIPLIGNLAARFVK